MPEATTLSFAIAGTINMPRGPIFQFDFTSAGTGALIGKTATATSPYASSVWGTWPATMPHTYDWNPDTPEAQNTNYPTFYGYSDANAVGWSVGASGAVYNDAGPGFNDGVLFAPVYLPPELLATGVRITVKFFRNDVAWSYGVPANPQFMIQSAVENDNWFATEDGQMFTSIDITYDGNIQDNFGWDGDFFLPTMLRGTGEHTITYGLNEHGRTEFTFDGVPYGHQGSHGHFFLEDDICVERTPLLGATYVTIGDSDFQNSPCYNWTSIKIDSGVSYPVLAQSTNITTAAAINMTLPYSRDALFDDTFTDWYKITLAERTTLNLFAESWVMYDIQIAIFASDGTPLREYVDTEGYANVALDRLVTLEAGTWYFALVRDNITALGSSFSITRDLTAAERGRQYKFTLDQRPKPVATDLARLIWPSAVNFDDYWIHAVSNTGVIVGSFTYGPTWTDRAFRWSQTQGFSELIPGTTGVAIAVTNDGTKVLCQQEDGLALKVWEHGVGVVLTITAASLSQTSIIGMSISGDGTRITFNCSATGGVGSADTLGYTWTSGTGAVATGTGYIQWVSNSGQYAVGSQPLGGSGAPNGYRWSLSTGLTAVPTGVSPSMVDDAGYVYWQQWSPYYSAVKWNGASTVYIDGDGMDGVWSFDCVSADGLVLAGWGATGTGSNSAVVRNGNMTSLGMVKGGPIGDYVDSIENRAISPNGQYVVGDCFFWHNACTYPWIAELGAAAASTYLLERFHTQTAPDLLKNSTPKIGGTWIHRYETINGVGTGAAHAIGISNNKEGVLEDYTSNLEASWHYNNTAIPVADSRTYIEVTVESDYAVPSFEVALTTHGTASNAICARLKLNHPGLSEAQISITGDGGLTEAGTTGQITLQLDTSIGKHIMELRSVGNVYTLYWDHFAIHSRTITPLSAAGFAGLKFASPHPEFWGTRAWIGNFTVKG